MDSTDNLSHLTNSPEEEDINQDLVYYFGQPLVQYAGHHESQINLTGFNQAFNQPWTWDYQPDNQMTYPQVFKDERLTDNRDDNKAIYSMYIPVSVYGTSECRPSPSFYTTAAINESSIQVTYSSVANGYNHYQPDLHGSLFYAENVENKSNESISGPQGFYESSENSIIPSPVNEVNMNVTQSYLSGGPQFAMTRRNPVPANPVCGVCYGQASGRHYNAITCEGCKGFFRRVVINRTKYECKDGTKKCHISMANRRKSCRSCRYERCISIGMQPELCLRGNNTRKRR